MCEKTAPEPKSCEMDLVLVNCNLATMCNSCYGAIEDAALAVKDGRIAWLGPRAEMPAHLLDGVTPRDLNGAWITPGLIDCHRRLAVCTHLTVLQPHRVWRKSLW